LAPTERTVRCAVLLPEARAELGATRTAEARLQEALGLAEALGLPVFHAEIVRLGRPRPSTLFGKGTVERLAPLLDGGDGSQAVAKSAPAEGKPPTVVFVDSTLSPVQQRNLERAWNSKVIDRTGLILEIFGARARSREGKLQVELAACTYQRSRLVRTWTHLERQRGGFGFLAGPGETQIESDRRQLDDRILRLRQALGQVRRTRALHRRARQRSPGDVVALVGYTNAGKSTLFNALTGAGAPVRKRLFETLDTTMRGVRLPSGRQIIVSDTVGFISQLPHELVRAFHATLEEVCEANLVLHVRDVAHADAEAQREDVIKVLRELGRGDGAGDGIIEVLNKIDLLSDAERGVLRNRLGRSNEAAVALSAKSGEGVGDLLAAIDRRLAERRDVVELVVDVTDGAALAWLYANGEVLAREDDDRNIRLRVRLDASAADRYANRRTAAARR
jgi:GTP-binding protein HflX